MTKRLNDDDLSKIAGGGDSVVDIKQNPDGGGGSSEDPNAPFPGKPNQPGGGGEDVDHDAPGGGIGDIST